MGKPVADLGFENRGYYCTEAAWRGHQRKIFNYFSTFFFQIFHFCTFYVTFSRRGGITCPRYPPSKSVQHMGPHKKSQKYIKLSLLHDIFSYCVLHGEKSGTQRDTNFRPRLRTTAYEPAVPHNFLIFLWHSELKFIKNLLVIEYIFRERFLEKKYLKRSWKRQKFHHIFVLTSS